MVWKKYFDIFNFTTFVVTGLALLSCLVCSYYGFTLHLDFLLIGLMIVFPLTLSIKEAFKRRERALQYLSLFKASLQSVFYSIQNSKIDKADKDAFRALAISVTDHLCAYLLSGEEYYNGKIHEASEELALFIYKHKKHFKGTLAQKILLFLVRVNESIEFLVATKRHHTPKILRSVVLAAIILFAIFYPAALLHEAGSGISFLNLSAMTTFKTLMLISLYNIQSLLENPFNKKGTDGIRVGDFAFTANDFPPLPKKEKEENEDNAIDEDLPG